MGVGATTAPGCGPGSQQTSIHVAKHERTGMVEQNIPQISAFAGGFQPLTQSIKVVCVRVQVQRKMMHRFFFIFETIARNQYRFLWYYFLVLKSSYFEGHALYLIAIEEHHFFLKSLFSKSPSLHGRRRLCQPPR